MLGATQTSKISTEIDPCSFVKPQQDRGLAESFIRVGGTSKCQTLCTPANDCEKTMKLDAAFEFGELPPDLARLAYRMHWRPCG